MFEGIPEQPEASRHLAAAVLDGAAHAYLLYGPAGVGKRAAALGFAGAILGDERRVIARAHPDLYVLEALGDMIRIDAIRELRHDLHMRPYEGDRRVYLVLDADRMNEDAADALLKDLEEPPAYATIVLVADELGPLPETIRSRCQLVPFRRLAEPFVRRFVEERDPSLSSDEVRTLARVAGGRLDRATRLLDPGARARRAALLSAARSVYLDEEFAATAAAATVSDATAAQGLAAREREAESLEGTDLPAREVDQRVRRAQRGAERDELLASLDELAAWYRDLVVVAAGAEAAVVHADRLEDLRTDIMRGLGSGPERAAARVRETWRIAEELNVNTSLALEALFVQLRRDLVPG